MKTKRHVSNYDHNGDGVVGCNAELFHTSTNFGIIANKPYEIIQTHLSIFQFFVETNHSQDNKIEI